MEQIKTIKGWYGKYSISNKGYVYNNITGKQLTGHIYRGKFRFNARIHKKWKSTSDLKEIHL